MISQDVLTPTFTEAFVAPREHAQESQAVKPISIRPLQPSDRHALLAFFRRIPVNERGRFFPDAVIDPVLVAKWCSTWATGRSRVLVAWEADRMVGGGAIDLDRQHMKGHVGHIRMAIDPQYRRRGLGHMIMRELLDLAPHLGLAWVDAEVGSHELPALRYLRSLSFQELSVLPDHGRDLLGNKFDMILMSRQVGPAFAPDLGGQE